MRILERLSNLVVYLFSGYLLFALLTSSTPLEIGNVGEIDKVIKMTIFFMVAIVPVLLTLLGYYVRQNTKAEQETTVTYLKIIANQEKRADKEVETLSSIADALKILERNNSYIIENVKEIKSLLGKK